MIKTLLFATAAALLMGTSAAHANSPELQALTIPAGACQVATGAGPAARAQLVDVDWFLNRNGRAFLDCPVPVAHGTIDSFRVLYSDPDGIGQNAGVRVFINQSSLLPPQGLSISFVCADFLSNFQSQQLPGWKVTTVVCTAPVTISPDARVSIQVMLWRRGPADTSFAPSFGGVDFP